MLATGLIPLTLIACSGNDADTPGDETIRQIAGVAELAANAYASAGPEGLYDYLLPEITERCSKEALVQALVDQPVPDGFRRLENVRLERHTVRATVVQLFGGEEKGVEWTFWTAPAPKTSPSVWRIAYLPGLEECLN